MPNLHETNKKTCLSSDSLLAGWSRAEIPVQSGMPLAGYAPVRLCTGVHDPLYARVFLAEQAGKRQILVHLDLLAADEHLCSLIRRELEQDGFSFEDLIVHAIPTHSAPAGYLDTREGVLKAARPFAAEYNPKQSESLARLIARTIEKTAEHLQPCSVAIGDGICENVSSNRVLGKDPKMDADERMTLIEVRQKPAEEGKEQSALFVFFGCHPTVLNASNTLASADLFGLSAEKLEKDRKAGQVFMMNKACGDLSCRYTRQKSGFEECERLADLLAAAAETIELHPAVPALFDFHRLKTEVQAASVPDEAQALRELEDAQEALQQRSPDCPPAKERELRLAMEKAQVRLAAARGKDGARTRTIEFLVCRWNDRNIVLAPGELFYTLSQKDNLQLLKDALILGNTNGYQLYMADRPAHDLESYEALSSPFAEGEMERAMEQLEGLLEALKKTDEEESGKFRIQKGKML